MHYVFFFPDEMRAKSLCCYGNAAARTPNYDRLAAEGTLFEQNYTAHPVCVPSRCSLMTGWYPHVAGFRTLKYLLQPWHPNFLRYIHEAGFETHLYGKNHVFSEPVYRECVDKWLYADFDHGRLGVDGAAEPLRDYTMLEPPLPDSELENLHDTRCVEAAIQALRAWRPGDKPLFIFLPTLMPHAPYSITESYYNMYDPDELPDPLPADLPGKPSAQGLIRRYRELEGRDAALFRKIQAVYLGMCSYVDMLLGRLLDALDETGLADDTTVIAASDHGDWAGDWGLVEKWPNCMDDDLTRVPLLIRRPGGAAGHRVRELTQTMDILPTICAWEGIPIRHDHFGVSLAAQVAGAAGDPARTVWCEGGYDRREPHCFEGTKGFSAFNTPGTLYYPKMIQQQRDPDSVCRTTMLRDARWKLVMRTNGENELYDMANDPDELTNLYADRGHEGVVQRLERRMLEWLIHTADVVPHEGHDL